MSENDDSETITKRYHCKICNETHTIELKKNLTEGRSKYPFPYVYLHDTIVNGSAKEVLSILYIDRSFQIRAAEVQEFDENHLFSKDQVIAITNPLMEEIKILREDLVQKEKALKALKEQIKVVDTSI